MASGKDDKALILDSSVSPKSFNIGKYEVREISCSYVHMNPCSIFRGWWRSGRAERCI